MGPTIEVTKAPRPPLGDASNRINQSPAKSTGKGKISDTAGKKRKSQTSLEDDIAAYKQNLDHVISPNHFDLDQLIKNADIIFDDTVRGTCADVRDDINKVLDRGIMNKTEFTKSIGVSASSLNDFLKLDGKMAGSGSKTYRNAYAWFEQRKLAEIDMPEVNKRQKTNADNPAPNKSNANPPPQQKKSSQPKQKAKANTGVPDISGIHLDGEEDDGVQIYDTCDEMRKKINAHLRKSTGLTLAQFCRDLKSQLHRDDSPNITSSILNRFLSHKGPISGAKSIVYYASYVYFEKLRLAQGKPKSVHRQTVEDCHPNGMDRTVDHTTTFFTMANERPCFDKYGNFSISGGSRW
ncbi:hypothetical protein GGR57DRAFT_488015 [Xylariaceae sp. FL1272]|nr:hypothetical protein GGR57DRAFT_488015 [Xylariaceae sp. FL1272]